MQFSKEVSGDSPRQGIIKSSKNIRNIKNKKIKLDFLMSKKSISIDDESSSLKANNLKTIKDNQYSSKQKINFKKSCLKNADFILSLKRINAFQQIQNCASTRSLKSNKSIKFNKKTNFYQYNKILDRKQNKIEMLQKVMNQNPVLIDEIEDQKCCQIY